MTHEPNQPREHALPAGQSERQSGDRERQEMEASNSVGQRTEGKRT